VLGTARLPEGVDGVARFHELAASFLPDDGRPGQVMVCIETDRGPWVRALAVAGYRVYAVNPGRPPGTGSCCRCRGPRVTRLMHTPWRTWSAPAATSSARSPRTGPHAPQPTPRPATRTESICVNPATAGRSPSVTTLTSARWAASRHIPAASRKTAPTPGKRAPGYDECLEWRVLLHDTRPAASR
jgi:hypothetical protein